MMSEKCSCEGYIIKDDDGELFMWMLLTSQDDDGEMFMWRLHNKRW
jgi:hypothetical protein